MQQAHVFGHHAHPSLSRMHAGTGKDVACMRLHATSQALH